MNGLLTDMNIQGQRDVLVGLLRALDLYDLLAGLGVRFLTFPEVELHPRTPDRQVMRYCDDNRLVLFTDNRNDDGPDSLEATLRDSLHPDSLPVLTVSDKERFRTSSDYQRAVAKSVAEILFAVHQEAKYLGLGRMFVPLPELD